MTAISDHWCLDDDLREVISSWLLRKDAIPARWRGEMDPTKAMPLGDAQALGVEKCAELVSRARATMLRLKPLSDTLSKLSSAMRTEFEDAQTNYKAVSKMHGIISIPNEVLTRIFDYIVNGEDTKSITFKYSRRSRVERPEPGDMDFPPPIAPMRSKAAVTLSSVCRYFRETVVSSAILWPNVTKNKHMAALCLERSKLVPLNMHFNILVGKRDNIHGGYKLLFDQSLQGIQPHFQRLGRLEIDFTNKEQDATFIESSNICPPFHRFDAPSLHTLHIHRPFFCPKEFLNNHAFEGWNVPRLRHLVTKHYFPLGIPGLKNLRSLDISFDLGEIYLFDIIQALSSMMDLADFHLMVRVLEFKLPEQIPVKPIFERTYLPSIRRLKIGIDAEEHAISSTSTSALKAFFSSLFFPRVTDLHLNIISAIDTEYLSDVVLNETLTRLVHHEDQYPCVERLCLEVIDSSRADDGHLVADIPLDKLPNTKELTLCSNTRFRPSASCFDETDHPTYERITIKAIEEGIRTIDPFVSSVMERQKDRGDWGSFRELVVVNTRQVTMGDFGLEYATRIYEGDAALQWCANGTPEIPTFV